MEQEFVSSQKALELLKNCQWAVLSTTDDKGLPYSVPISPVLHDNAVYFHCSYTGKKIENIQMNRQVCFTVVGDTKLRAEKFSADFESAILYGEAEVVEDELEKMLILRIISEKYAKSNMASFEQVARATLHKTCIIKTVPTTATYRLKGDPSKNQ